MHGFTVLQHVLDRPDQGILIQGLADKDKSACSQHLTEDLDLQALQEVLSNGTSSLFSQLMANWSVDAIAQAVDLRPCPGDSFSDQVLAYAAPPPPHADRPPLGLPVGSAIGAAFVLAVTATLCVYIHRQGKQKRQQQVGNCFGILSFPCHCT